jgi:hypothetical protein
MSDETATETPGTAPTEGLLGVDLSNMGTQMKAAADAPVMHDRVSDAIRERDLSERRVKDYANPSAQMNGEPDLLLPPTVGRDREVAEVPSEPGDVAPVESPDADTLSGDVQLEVAEEPEVVGSGDGYYSPEG